MDASIAGALVLAVFERTDEAPGLRCDLGALGSVYLGGSSRTQLVRTRHRKLIER